MPLPSTLSGAIERDLWLCGALASCRLRSSQHNREAQRPVPTRSECAMTDPLCAVTPHGSLPVDLGGEMACGPRPKECSGRNKTRPPLHFVTELRLILDNVGEPPMLYRLILAPGRAAGACTPTSHQTHAGR